MKKQILLLLMMLLPMVARAQAVEIDGIYYELVSKAKEAIVKSFPKGSYSGSVVIPASVTYDEVEYSVTSIGEQAFFNCSGLTSITIGNNVTSIGNEAFRDCRSLTSVTIGNSVTNIGERGFRDCSSLTYVHVSDIAVWLKISFSDYYSNPLFYAHHLYLGDEEIKDLVIPSNVKSIGRYAFRGCSSLTSVTIPNSVTSIGIYAFEGCSGLSSVTIPNSVKSIEYSVFENCIGLTSVRISDIAAWCEISFSDYYSNPLYYAHHLYVGGEEITDLVIPNSVTSIENYAFEHCSGLTSVTIPNSVTSIGEDTFSGCGGLTSLTIPNSVTNIGECAFSGCVGLTSITIPNSVTILKRGTFAHCSGLITVTIPNSVTRIESNDGYGNFLGVFQDCSSLTSVTIPNSVTSIGYYAFSGCSGLTSVHISDIAAWCKISFGSNPLTYAHHLYLGEEEIKDLVIPNNVTSIGGSAFTGCRGLTSISIGNSVTSIGEGAFYGCSGLTSVTIPNSVTSIGYRAFYECSGLTSITIGSGVTNIYSQSFAFCKELMDVYCLAEEVPVMYSRNYGEDVSGGTDAFKDSFIEYATLHVPAASINAYKAKEPWKSFKEIKSLTDEDIPSEPEVKKCATPTIQYENGVIKFFCSTDDVRYHYILADTDIGSGMGNNIVLEATYTISVYATRDGYDDSEIATATLFWIDAEFKSEGLTSNIFQVRSNAVFVNTKDGQVNISGLEDGTNVCLYNVNGMLIDSGISKNGKATINSNLPAGCIAVVKIGNKSIKTIIK